MSLKHKLKAWLPSPESLKQDKRLKILGDLLHNPNIWHINRRSVSGACAIGFAAAWCPLPIQMLLAAVLAIMLHKNLAVAAFTTWITNPVTVPPMFYFAYWVGTVLLGMPATSLMNLNIQLTSDWFFTQLGASWQPFLLGCAVLSLLSGCLGYFGMQMLWRYHVLSKLRQRKQRVLAALRHHDKAERSKSDKVERKNKS
ncbi:MAG: ATP-binding protein [Gammaproteobacteria bacterium]|nr:MAG: ATP-binding protein [Gammaproteobacteria bacterium]